MKGFYGICAAVFLAEMAQVFFGGATGSITAPNPLWLSVSMVMLGIAGGIYVRAKSQSSDLLGAAAQA
jgi:hypothetical protein